MPQPNVITSHPNLQALAPLPRWVAYSGAPKEGKIDKAPLNPTTGRLAHNDKPATWGTREAAEARAKTLKRHGHKPGVGIELGDLGDGTALCGVDLDGCHGTALEPWAEEICERFKTDSEVSPSGEGVKLFFRVKTEDVAAIRTAKGILHKTEWKRTTHYGAELHLSNSYFTVTGRAYGGHGDALRLVPLADLLWLVNEAGPAFLKGGAAKVGESSGRDGTRSADAYRLLLDLFRAGSTEEEAVAAIELDQGPAGQWWREKDGRQHERALARTRAQIEKDGQDLIADFDLCWTSEELEEIEWNGLAGDPTEDAKPKRGKSRFALDQDGIIRAFTERHAGELRFDHHSGRWYRFDGNYWQPEETKLAHHYARELSTELAKHEPKAKPLKAVATWEAVERGARSVREFACTSSLWDKDPMLLGTPGGTVDLKTGRLRKGRPGDFISKVTAVAPFHLDSFDPARDCPQWLAFLDFALDGDAAAIRFLQQWAGYCLTGDTREQVLLFIYGPGGGGKGTAINTLSDVLGGYAVGMAASTLTAKKYEAHAQEIARLDGPRMAFASETEKGSKWAENRIKALTGQDVLTANFMRENSFNFRPQFKLTIIGNNAPGLSDVDSAIRRRFMVLPFDHPPARKDDTLGLKLKAEWAGILSWMIQGCLDWQANGLVRPAVVNTATESYFAEQDTFGQWLADCCDTGLGRTETTERLYESWQRYAFRMGEEPGSKLRDFPERMQQRGFRPVKNTGGIRGRGFAGVCMAQVEEDFPDDIV